MAHTEAASINFLKWIPLYETERPFQVFIDNDLPIEGQRNTNLVWEEKDIVVEDFRGNKDYVDIDNHGFTCSTLKGFERLESAASIEEFYIPAVRKLLQRELSDVGTVFIYDWDSSTYYPDGRVNFGDQRSSLLPSNFAHVDMAPISIVKRIQNSFPKQADAIFAQRIRAINVWKPVNYPVEQWSLAVCDGNTIKSSELVETDSVRRESITTLYYAQHSSEQKWHFLHRQTPEEALTFKHFDSDPNVKSSRVMHSSIRHKKSAPDAKPRRSIEVRALIFSGNFEPSMEGLQKP